MTTLEVQKALNKIEGLQLTVLGYAASMRMLGFGRQAEGVSATGRPCYSTPYSLHIQAPWHLSVESTVITGSSDWWERADGSDPEGWDPTTGGSLQEKIFRDVLSETDMSRRVLLNATKELYVLQAQLEGASLKIRLSPDYELWIFRDGSCGEHWRLMDSSTGRHYVSEGNHYGLIEPA